MPPPTAGGALHNAPDVTELAAHMQHKLGIEQRPLSQQEVTELAARLQQLMDDGVDAPPALRGRTLQRGRGEASPGSSQDTDERDFSFMEELEDLFGEMSPDASATGHLQAYIRSAWQLDPELTAAAALRRLATTPEPAGDATRRLPRQHTPAAAVIIMDQEDDSSHRNSSGSVTSSPRSTPAAAAAAAASTPWRCLQRRLILAAPTDTQCSRLGHRRLALASAGGGARAAASPIQVARLLRRQIVKHRSKARPRLPSPAFAYLEGLMTHTMSGLRVTDLTPDRQTD